MAVRRNFLNHGQIIKLGRWLDEHKDDLAKLKPSLRQAGEMATKDLGFNVNENNIKGIVETGGFDDLFYVKTTGGKAANDIRAKVEKLRQALAELYNKVGESVPEDIGIGW